MPSGSVPDPVVRLVERFERNRDSYLAGGINETQLRQEFINPFFSCLGWDIENKQGYAPAYREVIFEDSLRVGAETKAPDYCFRIGGMRKFFVEAKKPAVNIATGVAPAFQLKRYAWTAKLPLSILTDFEEFAVYDCRARPFKTDKSSIGRIKFLEFKDYPERWTELYETFSRDAVVKGSFDKFVEENRARKGTTEVDDAFLSDIERWRDLLARNIALRNPRLTTRELNFAVQRTIDRIIFLRICEDRLIEPYGQLQALLNGERVYPRLKEAFQRADDRYNSGIFHFRPEKNRPEAPDELSLKLAIDDKALKDIIANLYYPDSPYEFSVFPSEILGQVYEQFLGKVIRLTAGHQAKVEDKPEVRKAGGVYYTPTYIVDYIVKNTVGKLLEGGSPPTADRLPREDSSPQPSPQRGEGEDSLSLERERARVRVKEGKTPTPNPRPLTPAQASRLRILDPACGSGSFLLGAYQYLLNWHRDSYVKDGPERHTKELFPAQGGDWRLTTAKKKEILLNNIYGVDIDQQAVEVTKLSLLLKVLEGENEQTIQSQLKLFQERALPDLGNNIKCGNSLIGPDFYQGEQQNLFDDEEQRLKVNAFDWQAEFPDIMKAGGFDAVIGNPPYVRIQGSPTEQVDYFTGHYRAATGNFDLYAVFVEKGYDLLSAGGRWGNILPSKFFRTDYGQGLRAFLAEHGAVDEVVDFGANQVFDATTYTCLLFLTKRPEPRMRYAKSVAKPQALKGLTPRELSRESLGNQAWTFADNASVDLQRKLGQGAKRLLDLPAEMSRGSSSGDDSVFVVDSGESLEEGILRYPLFATDFGRFCFSPSGKWRIIFPYVFESGVFRLHTENELRTKFPRAHRYLSSHVARLKRRKQYAAWYGFSAPRNLELHDRAQIAISLLAERGSFALIPARSRGKLCPMASGGFTVSISPDCGLAPEYVLGLLNSKLLFWRLRGMSNVFRGGWITCTKQYFGELPIRMIDFSNKADTARHDKMVSLAECMLKLHKDLPKARAAPDKTAIERQIAATDRQIDALVYGLYGLTEEEIRTVEGERR
jgi:predicted type IV restriction endonuclease